MGVYLFAFVSLCVVTAMVIRVRDLENERAEGPGDPSPACGLVRDDNKKDAGRREKKGREDHF